MPIRAYVLLRTDPGKANDVAAKAANLPTNSPIVKTAHAVTGRFDVVLQIEADAADSVTDIGKLVNEKVSRIQGIHATETLLVV